MTRKIQLTIIISMISAVFSLDHRYCELETCPNRTHTLCKYPQYGPSSRCGNSIGFGLTGSEVQLILRIYNSYRPGLRLYEHSETSETESTPERPVRINYLMQWDAELAGIAQRWADQCVQEVDVCRNVDRFYVRQRAGIIRTARRGRSPPIYSLVSRWFFEDTLARLDSPYFRGLSLEEIFNVASEYYARLLEHDANRVGCGAVRSFDYRHHKLFLVCNFGHA